MLRVGVAALATLLALPAYPETVRLGVEIEIVSAAKICTKAVAVLMSGPGEMTDAQARAFMLVDGQPNTGKCLEVIFSVLSSPTNGFKVHEVTSRPRFAEP